MTAGRRRNARRRLGLALSSVGLVLLLFAPPAFAQFRQIETPNLRLMYYGRAQEFIAPYTAQCFERSLQFYKHQFDWVPSDKVNVIIDDSSDFMNAAAGVTPRNFMLVQLAPANFVYETTPGNERINFTMNHEAAHLVTLDQAAGWDRVWRGLFNGKVDAKSEHPETMLYTFLTVPRRASTRWYREGMAVFFETWMAGGLGRAQGPYDEMVFRAMVHDDAPFWDPLGVQSAAMKSDFQVGVNAYLYGTRFVSWLAWEHGPQSLIEWLSRKDGSSPYFANQFKKVYGKSLNDAWFEWIEWERGWQNANIERIREYPVTPARDLSPRALGSVSRAFVDSTTNSLIGAVLYPGAVAHIASLSLDDRTGKVLQEVKGPALLFVSSLAFDPDRRLLFYTTDNNGWRDLNVYDLATDKSRRLIQDARMGDLAFNRQTRDLYGVRHLNGSSTIVRLQEPWDTWTQVVSYPYGRDVYDLDVSPDGTQMSMSMSEISGRQTLRTLPLDSLGSGERATRMLWDFDKSVPQSFVYSPDNRFLYGSSYYTGVSNIFRYDLVADSMDVVSNATTGFFRPVPTGGDSLIVFRYTGKGFVPAIIEDRILHDVSAVRLFGAELVQKYPELKAWKVPPPSSIDLDTLTTYEGDYIGARGVRLANAYPIYQNYKDRGSVGLRLDFSDPLLMHSVNIAATYSPESNLESAQDFHVAAGYEHGNMTAKAWYNPASFYDLFGPTKRSRKGYGGSLRHSQMLIRDLPRTLEIDAGLSGYGGLEVLPYAQNIEVTPGFDVSTSADISIQYTNRRSSIGAIDHEKGVQAGAYVAMTTVRFDDMGRKIWRGFPQIAGNLDLGTPLPLRNSSLWLRNQAGWSPGDRDEPFANFFFGAFGNNVVDHQSPKRYREYQSFPGVEINEIAGTNFAKTMVEWNLPPVRFSRLGFMRLYASWARMSVFGSALVTNVDLPSLRTEIANVGAQADVRFQFLIQQPLTLSLGWAKAFEEHIRRDDEWMVSLKIL